MHLPPNPASAEPVKFLVAFSREARAASDFDSKLAYERICKDCGLETDPNVLRKLWSGTSAFPVTNPSEAQVAALKAHELTGAVAADVQFGPAR